MSYQVLARKWRPAQFKDVIGQDHVVKSLVNSVLNKKIGQAYLFTGTRGVGKTTIARIFARAIRCEKNLADGSACGVCLSCSDSISESSMNIFEIDGASNIVLKMCEILLVASAFLRALENIAFILLMKCICFLIMRLMHS